MSARQFKVYKTYRFIDHDPVIDLVRTLVQDSGYTYTAVQKASSVSAQTLGNWMNGKTRRPQYATIAAVIYALNGKMQIIDEDGTVVNPTSQSGRKKK